ncbi:MAG: shikimate dehydrogenase [Verrucomicrobiota bacterium]
MSVPETLTLALLREAEFKGPQLGVLGDPIAHSLSPAMHNAAIAALVPTHPKLAGLHYHRLHITAAELSLALPLLRNKGFIGLNLTVPHKIQALELVTQLSPEARQAASVNTLTIDGAGWAGHTTDGRGFIEALRENSGHSVQGRDIILLGAGGAARAVAAACLTENCRSLKVYNRDGARAQGLAEALHDPRVSAHEISKLGLPSLDAIIVNCTTLGLKASDSSPLPAELLQPGQFIFDTTYGSSPAQLIRDARAKGISHCDGRAMLRWQGALAFQLWTGTLPPAAPMRQALGEPAL